MKTSTSKLDRNIFYRIEIRTVDVQSDDVRVVGHYQRLKLALRVDWRYHVMIVISLDIFVVVSAISLYLAFIHRSGLRLGLHVSAAG